MRKPLIAIVAAFIALGAHAQLATCSQPMPLLQGTQSNMYYPVFSPDGQSIMFSDVDHSNLREYSFADNVTTSVKATPKQALKAAFTPAGKVTLEPQTTVRVDDSNLIITRQGKEISVSPVQCTAGYLWPSLSPDGSKIMFVAAGKGIVITDLQGNILARPGHSRLEAPVWYGNNHIVAMNTTDDGHQITSSQIVLLDLNGTQQQITKPTSMAMFPAANQTTGRIVYNTIDGLLYQINITLNSHE